jgi:hypothetical protein
MLVTEVSGIVPIVIGFLPAAESSRESATGYQVSGAVLVLIGIVVLIAKIARRNQP